MKCKNIKKFTFSDFCGGINKSLTRTDIKANELSDSLNMYQSGSFLTAREGFCSNNSFNFGEDFNDCDIKLIGSQIYTDDGLMKIYHLCKNNSGNYKNAIFIVNSNGFLKQISLPVCNSNDFSGGIEKINCCLIKGKPSFGNGIFILFSVADGLGEITFKKIYEINSFITGIFEITANEIYSPLVMVNGRGNKFSSLSATARTNYPKPSMLEDFNLLSTGFRACFKTDGVSDGFYLPVKNLSSNEDENIKVKLTVQDGTVYNFTIPYDSNFSGYNEIDSKNIRVGVNREAGYIFFQDNTLTSAPPKISEGLYNNLEITAYKPYGNSILFTSSVSESFNSRAYLSGCKKQGNAVFYSKKNNPLYFPSSSVAYFGDKSGVVTAFSQQNDRLIIFKAHQIGICSKVSTQDYNTELIILGKSNRRATAEKMDISSINTGIGCIYPETLVNCANRLVFLGTDKKVYTITSSANYLQRLYKISEKIENTLALLSINSNAFAVNFKGHYLLFVNKSCFLFNYNTDAFLSASSPNSKSASKQALGWFEFEFNIGNGTPFSALSIDDDLSVLVPTTLYVASNEIFIYTFGGDTDGFVTSDGDIDHRSFKVKMTTKASDFDSNRLKKINGLSLDFGKIVFEEPPCNITLKYINENLAVNGTNIIEQEEKDQVVIKRNPLISGVKNFGFSLESNCRFSLKKAQVEYKEY